ncbi:MAG: DNA polymerase III subunit alpha [bacterium]|nr:DNA polymerase III subunit alpha [bacterium]
MGDFVHLHVHTEFSLLDGLSKVKDAIKHVKKNGMDALAITDHGSMFGVIDFYKACQKEEIKAIIGVETYVARRAHNLKEGRQDAEPYHLLLLAKNYTGYKNLMKMISIAHIEGYYYRPRVDKTLLREFHEGIIATSACLANDIARAHIAGNYEEAKRIALDYQDIFGEGNFYLEIQRHYYRSYLKEHNVGDEIYQDLSETQVKEDAVYEGNIRLSRETGIPLVATNDCHYITQEDAEAQDCLICIGTGKQMAETTKRLRMVDARAYYLASPDEMKQWFKDVPDALENTVKIAEMCNLEIPIGKSQFPVFEIPEGYDPDGYLRHLTYEGAKTLLDLNDPIVTQRLDWELDIIKMKGYPTYFMIVADFMNWANNNKIITNTRGSAAGSLVSFAMGITTVNPLVYNLPFERFLNPLRPSTPDIDADMSDIHRDDLINYVKSKYGEDRVAQIGTFGKLMARAAVRDVARTMGIPISKADKMAKMVPEGAQGFPMTITRALAESTDLKQWYESDPEVRKCLDLAKKVEGNVRNPSVHAAGVVVSPGPMTDFTPLRKDDGKIITQYDMHGVEDVGLVKFDFLGIRNLSILGLAVDMVKQEKGIEVELKKIPLDDQKTYDILAKGQTMGLFQLGGSGMTKWLVELKPTRIDDLMAMVALFRPGPMAIIPEYINRRFHPEAVTYFDPRMESFLNTTYGLITYQDDVLMTAINMAGYDWLEADKFRKAMGKKIPEEMAKQKEKFIKGYVEHGKEFGVTDQKAMDLWKLIEPFSAYGFNKAHAASYGIVAYQTAYMKANFPVEFMMAVMTCESGNMDTVTEAVAECKNMHIEVLPPDVNKSNIGFTIEEGKDIRFGMNAIKNVGEAAVEAIIKGRKAHGEFKTLYDFCRAVDLRPVNKKTIECLIKTGAMDAYGTRAAQLSVLEQIMSAAGSEQKSKDAGQSSLFEMLAAEESEEDQAAGNMDIPIPNLPEINKKELLAWEKELLGFYLTEHPLKEALAKINPIINKKIGDISYETDVGKYARIGGSLAECRKITTKASGQEMCFITMEDDTGKLEGVVFPRLYAETKFFWESDRILIMEVKIESRDDKVSLIVDKVWDMDQLGMIPEYQERISRPNGSGFGGGNWPKKGSVGEEGSPRVKINPNDYKIAEDEPIPVSMMREKPKDERKTTVHLKRSDEGCIEVHVPSGTTKEKLSELAMILREHKGQDKMALLVPNGEAEPKRIDVPYGIQYGIELREMVENLFISQN